MCLPEWHNYRIPIWIIILVSSSSLKFMMSIFVLHWMITVLFCYERGLYWNIFVIVSKIWKYLSPDSKILFSIIFLPASWCIWKNICDYCNENSPILKILFFTSAKNISFLREGYFSICSLPATDILLPRGVRSINPICKRYGSTTSSIVDSSSQRVELRDRKSVV